MNNEVFAAIAMALHDDLGYNLHDDESGKLTIRNHNTEWTSKVKEDEDCQYQLAKTYTIMKEYKYKINGNPYAVTITETAADGTINVTVNGESYSVIREIEPVVEHKRVVVKPAPAKKNDNKANDLQDALCSPLPGTIVGINAKVGQEVKEGDSLIILEAMKMDNNLTAEHDGKVKAILVDEGEVVKENTPLVTFE